MICMNCVNPATIQVGRIGKYCNGCFLINIAGIVERAQRSVQLDDDEWINSIFGSIRKNGDKNIRILKGVDFATPVPQA